MRQSQQLKDGLGVRRQLFVLGVRLLRSREFDQFDLLELMLANDASDIASIGSGLAPKAGSISAQRDRETLGLEHLVAIKVGNGDLSGRGEPVIGVFQFEKVLSELREV